MLRKLPILLCMLALIISFSLDYTTKRDINLTLTPLQSDKNTAIYAGYSEDGTISDYVITYLKKLKEIAPNIVFVTDNQMSKRDLNKIRPYVNHIIAYRHGEYDWGSFKRGYNWLMSQNLPRHPSEPNGEVKGSSNYLNNNDTALAHPQEDLKPNTDSSSSTVILEAMRQHQHIGDPQTSALAHNNDSTLAHPQFKTERDSVAEGGINCHAMSDATSEVYKKAYMSECRRSYDGDLAHPQENLKPNTEGVAEGEIKYDAGSEFATAVYEKGYINESQYSTDEALAHPHHPHYQYTEKDFSLVLSHLSCADEQSHFMNYRQLENFIELKNKYFPNTMSSLSASDGVFLSTEFHFDMVRLGAAMYGINTAPYRENEMQNIVELKAPVLQVANANKGDFIGYSATYKCSKAMKIAIVSIGYGDGVPRSLSNKGKVLFYEHGVQHLCPILGRVSMDNIICDVSCLESIKVGDFGIIINQDYTVDDVAKDADTIAYELISRIGKNPRILKNYIDE